MFEKTVFFKKYIQHLRKYYEIPQQDLAKMIGINNSSLSKIEAGKQEMDEKTFRNIIKYFEKLDPEFTFLFDISLVEETERLIKQYIQSFIMMTYRPKIYELEVFLNKKKYWNSFAFFHMELLQALHDNFKNIDCTEFVKSLIDIHYFSDDFHLAVLYDLYAVSAYSMEKQILKQQIDALKKALGYCQSADAIGLKGLILYHLILKQKTSNDMLALQYFEECEYNLQKIGAYRRLLYSKLNKGNIYTTLGLYTLAEEIYKMLEKSQSQIDEKIIIPKIYECSSWCSLLQEKYEEAIEKARKAERLGSRFPDIYITFAYGYYKLGDIQSARQSITRFRNAFSSEPRVSFINSFFTILERIMDDKNVPDYLIERLFKKLPDFRDVELEMVLYPLLSDYYCSLGSFQEAYRIQKRWNDYLQFAKF